MRHWLRRRKHVKLINEFITYPGATGEMRAYLSMPEGKKKLPGVIVIHENRGLVPHIQDVNRTDGDGRVYLAGT